VTFQHKGRKLKTGVLCWRRLPDRASNSKSSPPPNRRLGDLVTQDGEQFRVNADLQGDGTKPYRVKLYIDFAKGTLPVESTGGTAWEGTLVLPDKGSGLLKTRAARSSKQELWQVPAAEVEMNARLVEDRNLLREMKKPK